MWILEDVGIVEEINHTIIGGDFAPISSNGSDFSGHRYYDPRYQLTSTGEIISYILLNIVLPQHPVWRFFETSQYSDILGSYNFPISDFPKYVQRKIQESYNCLVNVYKKEFLLNKFFKTRMSHDYLHNNKNNKLNYSLRQYLKKLNNRTESVFGSKEKAAEWLSTPHFALHNELPINYATNHSGLRDVTDILAHYALSSKRNIEK